MAVTAAVRRYVRGRRWLAVVQAWLRRCLVAGLAIGALLALARLLPLSTALPTPTLAWLLALAGLGAASLLLRPARLDVVAEDRAVQARDALATVVLTAGSGPAVELVARDAWLYLRSRPARQQAGQRRWRVLVQALVLALLVWLAFELLPGHRPVGGPGVASGQGAGSQGQTSGVAPKRESQSEKPEPRPSPQQRSDPEPAPQPEPPRQPRQQPRPPPGRVADLVVFPDFTAVERSTEREAPAIQRAPQATGGAAAPPPSVAPAREPPPQTPRLEWQRQRERALARQSLAPWEGAWLDRYGDALDAQPVPPPAKSRDR